MTHLFLPQEVVVAVYIQAGPEPTTKVINVQTCLAATLATLAKKLRTAPKIDLMIPSSAATAFPARRFKALDKQFSFFMAHATSLFFRAAYFSTSFLFSVNG